MLSDLGFALIISVLELLCGQASFREYSPDLVPDSGTFILVVLNCVDEYM